MLAQHKMQTTLAALAKCRVLFWRMKVGLERAAVFKKGKQLCSLAAPPPRLLLEDFSASFGKQQINSVRGKQSFFRGRLASIKTRS
jgi:hypothetical protein